MRRERPLRRRTPLKAAAGAQAAAKPRTRLRPISDKRRELERQDALRAKEEGGAFRAAIKGLRCVVCGRSEAEAYEETGLGHEAHHVVRQEVLKRLGLREHLWDPAAAVCVCEEPCHRRHTRRSSRIKRAAVPTAAVAFAVGLGLELEFEREYPS